MKVTSIRSHSVWTFWATALAVALISLASVLSITAAPDLTVVSVSAPATGVTGTTVQVIVTVSNLGTTATSSMTSIYLRTNNVASGTAWYSYTISLLASHAINVKTNNPMIEASTTLGSNYVIAVCGGNLGESTKANNTNSTMMVINAQ